MQTHAVDEKDRPLCRFSVLSAIEWPPGHQPATMAIGEVTCPACLRLMHGDEPRPMFVLKGPGGNIAGPGKGGSDDRR